MLTVDEAWERIGQEVTPREPERRELSEAAGYVLADDVTAAIDSPPFDKALMDGYAVRFADVASTPVELRVVEEVTAGRTPQMPIGAGEATRIMTGAPLPDGADAVVRVEDTSFDDATERVTITAAPRGEGANLARRGSAMRAGQPVLKTGHLLRAQEIGLLAELGQVQVAVRPRPVISVLATGDELVPYSQQPGEGQIRNSNEPMLTVQIAAAGATPQPLGIARDDRDALSAAVQSGLEADILCLSGGVSAGKLDLVPSVLEKAGVREVFHKVAVKPGKPLWFGVLDGDRTADGRPRFIFGLPGNPVSSMVCFELFVRMAVRHLQGETATAPCGLPAAIVEPFQSRGDRRTFLPVRLSVTAGGLEAIPVPWQGSFDLRATVDANGLLDVPPGDQDYHIGDCVDVIPFGRGFD
ncbi:Molybdopterin molybdenumtransferase [Maioricimonas rarisocia]|uniref:Molybdopterin molybdenumtransferase n=1 Tax=Maioricimonas rarisocia TaxID=2528026 RepID=A0A517ZEU9_9PLAN|nr:gephyrin-like molybdotransferase Glp [Maioricimonas rarisocia]QDU40984.1 Molybdopterin molybdenumtransferase [Maioricimonas rarisocia]